MLLVFGGAARQERPPSGFPDGVRAAEDLLGAVEFD